MDFAVVIVTYNRHLLLEKALENFDKQTIIPKYIIVVDNASTDKTSEVLSKWKRRMTGSTKIIIKNTENLGGSGGFYVGLDSTKLLPVDWIWVSDDDAIPNEDVIEKLQNGIDKLYKDGKNPVAVCGKVMNGEDIDIDHRRFIKKNLFSVKKRPAKEKLYKKEYFKIDEFSYVGTALKKDVLFDVGLTEKDFFICYDDTEHSWRLGKVGEIYCLPSVVIHHDVGVRYDFFKWSTYYAVRNKLVMYKKHLPNRYYLYEKYKQKSKNMVRKLIKTNVNKTTLYDNAIRDADTETIGKHDKYIPGWNENNL
mgnify:CR=1 FL=1